MILWNRIKLYIQVPVLCEKISSKENKIVQNNRRSILWSIHWRLFSCCDSSSCFRLVELAIMCYKEDSRLYFVMRMTWIKHCESHESSNSDEPRSQNCVILWRKENHLFSDMICDRPPHLIRTLCAMYLFRTYKKIYI